MRLPYRGESKSMLLVVPDDATDLAAIEGKLTAEQVQQWRTGLRSEDVRLQLPKFKTTQKTALGGALKALGMLSAFDPKTADLTGLIEDQNWHIAQVIHEAVVEVDEEGTVAAAATAVIVALPVSPPPLPRPTITVRADRPFLFLIVDDLTQAILFVGRVNSV